MPATDLFDQVTHAYAENGGVRIHYATLGSGPLVVLIHGFPDFWYTWRNQMPALAEHFQVAAMDLRGYNLSDKPTGGENYTMRHIIGDVAAVVRHAGHEKAMVVGHDWGGATAWQVAIRAPALVERLAVLNCPHPIGLARELAHNPQQQANSQYVRDFQQPDAHELLVAERLARWVKDDAARERYVEAFEHSDFEAMLHYYKQSYPHPPYAELSRIPPNVQAPTLLIHGLADKALLPGGLNDTWQWIDNEFTLITVPGAGHFVQHDAADRVTQALLGWLRAGTV